MHSPSSTLRAIRLPATGISKVDANLEKQLVSIKGTAAPSAIVTAIEATGREAILRGSGSSNSLFYIYSLAFTHSPSTGAAVCILETHSTRVQNVVRGLARMVQVSSNLTLVDLTVRGLSPGKYWATVRDTGDISEGAASTGGIWGAVKSASGHDQPKGLLGTVDVRQSGVGSVFFDRPVQIWEMIGRSIVISKQQEGPMSTEDPDTLVGVIARSAGVWENEKTVCSCTGKTVWEERREQTTKGMM